MRTLLTSAMALALSSMRDTFSVKSIAPRDIGRKKVRHGRTYKCDHTNDPFVFAHPKDETHADRMIRKKAQRAARTQAFLREVS